MENIKVALEADTRLSEAHFGKSIANLLWPAGADSDAFSTIDPRISKTLAEIEAAEDLNLRLSQLVESSGLSASRFRHLFSAQVGMSLKSYLL